MAGTLNGMVNAGEDTICFGATERAGTIGRADLNHKGHQGTQRFLRVGTTGAAAAATI